MWKLRLAGQETGRIVSKKKGEERELSRFNRIKQRIFLRQRK